MTLGCPWYCSDSRRWRERAFVQSTSLRTIDYDSILWQLTTRRDNLSFFNRFHSCVGLGRFLTVVLNPAFLFIRTRNLRQRLGFRRLDDTHLFVDDQIRSLNRCSVEWTSWLLNLSFWQINVRRKFPIYRDSWRSHVSRLRIYLIMSRRSVRMIFERTQISSPW